MTSGASPRTAPPLPVSLTSLVGREREIGEIETLLWQENVRLVTLTGPGGVGKTRLALDVARRLDDAFPDGIWLVRLEAIREVELVLATIAQTVGMADSTADDLVAHLAAWLGPGRHLFVIDNFEQVSEASPVLGNLLEAAPGLKILVTSRTSLSLIGEHEYPLDPLPLPQADTPDPAELMRFASVRLFVDRASEVRPSFALTSANADDVLAICRQLDGLPLAIELAAARTRILTPAALRERLGSRLKVLTSGSRNLPPRQQTMRDAIAWSYNLLSPVEQRLLRILSVFSGGFTLPSLEDVVGRTDPGADLDLVLEHVSNLVDHSLVRRVDTGDEEPRFNLMLTIQEFGADELAAHGEAQAAQRAHASVMAALAEEARTEMTGPRQSDWFERLEVEHDNFRAALTFAIGERDSDLAEMIAAPLWRFWWLRGHLTEGRRWYRQVIDLHSGPPTPALGWCLAGAASLAHDQGAMDESSQFGNRALEIGQLLGVRKLEAQALNGLGNHAHDQGRYEEALDYHRRSLAIYQEIGDKRGVAGSYSNLGTVSFYRNDLDGAEANYERARAILLELGDRRSAAMVMANIGAVAYNRGDYERSRDIQEICLAEMRDLGDEIGTANSLTNLGNSYLELGELDKAMQFNLESLEIQERLGVTRNIALVQHSIGFVAREQGDLRRAAGWLADAIINFVSVEDLGHIADGIGTLADVAHGLGDRELAVRIFGAAEALRIKIGVPRGADSGADYERVLGVLRQSLGDSRFEEEWEAGMSLDLPGIAACAAELKRIAEMTPQDPRELALQEATGLNQRQLDIVRRFAGGMSNAQIADDLGLTEELVSAQIGRIFTGLGLQSRAEVSAFAFKHGII